MKLLSTLTIATVLSSATIANATPSTTMAAKKAPELCPVGTSQGPRHPHCLPKAVDRIVAEGVDRPRLGRCTRITCPKGTTNLFRQPSVLAEWLALSVPRDRADEAPKTAPKGDPKAPIKLGIG